MSDSIGHHEHTADAEAQPNLLPRPFGRGSEVQLDQLPGQDVDVNSVLPPRTDPGDQNDSSSNVDIPSNGDDPSNSLWSIYVAKAEPYDKALTESWKVDTDGTLIFSGLFSAIITAFLVGSLQLLQQNPADSTVTLLQQISLQLAGSPAPTSTSQTTSSFEPMSSIVLVNSLWIISLVFALASALLSTLIQQWSRDYLQAVTHDPVPRVRSSVRSFLSNGITQFGVETVVDTVPLLLQIAVFLFLAGLVVYIQPMNLIVFQVTLGMTTIISAVYLVFTCLPILYHQCPFKTPASTVLRVAVHKAFRIYKEIQYGETRLRSGTFAQYLRQQVSNAIPSALSSVSDIIQALRPDRPLETFARDGINVTARTSRRYDGSALVWTAAQSWGDEEVETLIEAITGVVKAPSSDKIHHAIVALYADSTTRFGPRIDGLLRNCRESIDLPNDKRTSRAIAVISAIHILAADKGLSRSEPAIGSSRSWPIFSTAATMRLLQNDISPVIARRAICTSAVVASVLLQELLNPRIIHAKLLWLDQDISRGRWNWTHPDPIRWRIDALRDLGVLYCPEDMNRVPGAWIPFEVQYRETLPISLCRAIRREVLASGTSRYDPLHPLYQQILHMIETHGPQIPLERLAPIRMAIFKLHTLVLAGFLQAIFTESSGYGDDPDVMEQASHAIFQCLSSTNPEIAAAKVLGMLIAPIRHGRPLRGTVLAILMNAFEDVFPDPGTMLLRYAQDVLRSYRTEISMSDSVDNAGSPSNIRTVKQLLFLLSRKWPMLPNNQQPMFMPEGFNMSVDDLPPSPEFDSQSIHKDSRDTMLSFDPDTPTNFISRAQQFFGDFADDE